MSWTNVPAGTRSFVLHFHDPDVSINKGTSTQVHWLVWGIPGTATSLAENLPQGPQLPDGSRQISASGQIYRGPGMRAAGPKHHYTFELYALDTTIDVPTAPTSRRRAPRCLPPCRATSSARRSTSGSSSGRSSGTTRRWRGRRPAHVRGQGSHPEASMRADSLEPCRDGACAGATVAAHHSFVAQFDGNKPVDAQRVGHESRVAQPAHLGVSRRPRSPTAR